MNPAAHHTTVELSNCRLFLREDLSFHLQEYRGAPCYLIEDELCSKFYRIGLAEYHLISLFDGRTTVSQAIAKSAAEMGHEAVAESEAITICKWLLDSQLASTEASRSSSRLLEAFAKSQNKKYAAQLNPVSPKFSLFNPDNVLTKANDFVGWLFSFPMVLVWLATVAIGLYHVWANWAAIGGGQNMIFSTGNWFWLGLTFIGMKIIHEFAHGIACKRYGGAVRQAGLVLIVMIPLPYVDVTSSWRFRSKWHRIYVAGAGMYAEMFLAAVATIIWSYSDVGMVRQMAFNVMLTGSVATLIFNANPLMRFDGYYILSDWLELPNLGTHGQQFLNWVGNKYYLGLDVKKPSWPEGRGDVVIAYALGAMIWKVLIWVGLAIAAESLFFGAGIILSAMAICMWVLWPICKLLKRVFIGEETKEQPSRIRFCVLTSVCAALLFSAYHYVPWDVRVNAPAIVDYSTRTEIRVPLGGFLKELFVENDQAVKEGQLLAVLENPELNADVRILQIQLKENQLRMRQHRENQELAAFDVALKNNDALRTRLMERLDQIDELEIRASHSGLIIADDLNQLVGTYLSAGHKFCTLGSLGNKEIQALVSQKDLDQFKKHDGKAVEVCVTGNGGKYIPAVLCQLNPRARVSLPHPAFSAQVGGALAVKYRGAPSDSEDSNDSQFELVEPHFLAKVSLSDQHSKGLRAGQTAIVSIRSRGRSLGNVLSTNISGWLRDLRKQSQLLNR